MIQTSMICADESATQRLGSQILLQLEAGCLMALRGDLGAGKSVLARSIIHAAGYKGRVKSPTYTLMETYDILEPLTSIMRVAHLDLYRLADPEELHYLGFDDVLTDYDLTIVEWPENAGKLLPRVDIDIHLEYVSEGGRRLTLNADRLLSTGSES